MQLLNAPAIHKLLDYRILAGRRASQLLIVHVSEVFDVAHVDQHGHKRWIDRVILDLMPANVIDVLFRQRARLALVPVKHFFVRLEHR